MNGYAMTETNPNTSSNSERTFAQAADRASETLRPVMDQLLSSVQDAVERLTRVATQAAGKVALSGEYVKDVQQRTTRCTRGYIREKPLTAIGIALATGYLLSCALRQR